MRSEVQTYRDSPQHGNTLANVDITGFSVEALDGSIGKVDEATYDTEAAQPSHVIVDTGPWIFGRKVMLPAGVISSIDEFEEAVYVNCSKDEIKHAPEFAHSITDDTSYHDQLESYYGPGGAGQRI